MINGKIYIGQSVDPKRRFRSHCYRAKHDTDNSPIHAAIRKYGKDNFKLDILEWTDDYNQREIEQGTENRQESNEENTNQKNERS